MQDVFNGDAAFLPGVILTAGMTQAPYAFSGIGLPESGRRTATATAGEDLPKFKTNKVTLVLPSKGLLRKACRTSRTMSRGGHLLIPRDPR
jgi:hypothetical protein